VNPAPDLTWASGLGYINIDFSEGGPVARGEVTIDERFCKGCGYCVKFCPHDCIVQPGDKFSPQGYLLPVLESAERCNACGICAWMCPDHAIEVFKYVDSEASFSA
jgi:2-oxoglutarate ferredoxin oxidoreductase subunit delta